MRGAKYGAEKVALVDPLLKEQLIDKARLLCDE